MPSNSDLVFGKLAVKNKFLTEAQLGEAIRKQSELEGVGVSQSLPHLLAERGYLSVEKVEYILKLQNYVEFRENDKRFGAVALRNGFVTEDQIHECLTIQFELFRQGAQPLPRLGELLAQRGYVSEQQKEAILAVQGVETPSAAVPSTGLLQSVIAGRLAETNACPMCGKPKPVSAEQCVTCVAVTSNPPSAGTATAPPPGASPQKAAPYVQARQPAGYSANALFFKVLVNLARFAWVAPVAAAIVLAALFVPMLLEEPTSQRKREKEIASDPEQEFQSALAFEEANAATERFEDIRERYGQIVNTFSDTAAARKAAGRIGELDALYGAAERRLQQARADAETLKKTDRPEEAYVLWDELVSSLNAIPGRPLKAEAVRLKTEALTAAITKVNCLITKARQAARDGDLEGANAICASAKSGKLWELPPEVRALIGELEDELAVLAERGKHTGPDTTAIDKPDRQKTRRYQALVIEGREKESRGNLREAVGLYARALAIAGSPEEIASAQSDRRRVAGAVSDDCRALKSDLQLVKEGCAGKRLPEAIEKCKLMVDNPAYAAFREDLSRLLGDLRKIRTNPSSASKVVESIDNLAKTAADWKDAALASPAEMRCSKCSGSGSVPCVKCAGVGRTQDQPCPDCSPVAGRKETDRPPGVAAKCGKCDGEGKARQPQWVTKACPFCSERAGQHGCAQCKGGGIVRERILAGLVTCEYCKGTGKPSKDRPAGEKKHGKCIRCDGTGYIGKVCEQCAGLGKVSCTECNGSGIDPTLVE